MHERSLVGVKVGPRITSRVSSALFVFFYIIYVIKIYVR